MQKSAHILICDDQPIIHESLGVYLESEGFSHASAFNGVQAVKMAETEAPDLILMDLMMPEKNGMDACREIRQKSAVPIIMLTAKGEEIDRVVGLEIGAGLYRKTLLRTRTHRADQSSSTPRLSRTGDGRQDHPHGRTRNQPLEL